MTRAYLRLDPNWYDRKVLGLDAQGEPIKGWQPYPADALVAFLGVLALADQQADRGHFRSLTIVRELLRGDGRGARYARQLPFLLSVRDLVLRPGGRVYVEGWVEWQEGDLSVADRMRRMRLRRAGGNDSARGRSGAPPATHESGPVTVTPVTDAVTDPVTEASVTLRRARDVRGRSAEATVTEATLTEAGAPVTRSRPSLSLQPGEAATYALLDRQPTSRQRAMLSSIADQERGSERDVASGWAVVREWISNRPAEQEPLAWVRHEAKRVRAERRVRAEQRVTSKPAGPLHPGLVAAAKTLAGKGNGLSPSVDRPTALAQLRQARGLVHEPAWSALLARYGLTEADLDAPDGAEVAP